MRPDLVTVGADPGVDGAVLCLEWRGPVAVVSHLHLVSDGYKPAPRSQAHDRQAAMVRALRRIVATIGDPWPSVPVVVAVEASWVSRRYICGRLNALEARHDAPMVRHRAFRRRLCAYWKSELRPTGSLLPRSRGR